jgi:MFS family permease
LIADFFEKMGANRAVMALSVARLGDAVGNSILFVVIPLYVAKLPAPVIGLPETGRVGILISAYGLINALLQPIMGGLSDQTGKRKLFIVIGLILMGVGTLLFMVAGSFLHLLLFRLLQGIGVALTVAASMAIMAMVTSKRTRGGSMGIYTTMRMVGFALGPLLGGYLYDSLGFQSDFLVGAGFIFLGLIMVQIWIQGDPPPRGKKATASFRLIDTRLINSGIIGAGFATFLMASSFSMLVPLETQINMRLNETAFDFGLAFSALVVSRLIFQIPLGRASDRVGRKPLIILGLILMAPTTILIGFTGTTLQLIGTRIGQGLASAAIAGPAFAVAADLAAKGGEGRQMSIVTMGFGLGIALGPLLAGILVIYSFELPFLIGGLLSLVGAWIVFQFVPETVQREDQEPIEESGDRS